MGKELQSRFASANVEYCWKSKPRLFSFINLFSNNKSRASKIYNTIFCLIGKALGFVTTNKHRKKKEKAKQTNLTNKQEGNHEFIWFILVLWVVYVNMFNFSIRFSSFSHRYMTMNRFRMICVIACQGLGFMSSGLRLACFMLSRFSASIFWLILFSMRHSLILLAICSVVSAS